MNLYTTSKRHLEKPRAINDTSSVTGYHQVSYVMSLLGQCDHSVINPLVRNFPFDIIYITMVFPY